MTCTRLALLLSVLTLLFTQFVSAQTAHTGIVGHVTDVGGAVVQHARVELQPSATVATTYDDGNFTISGVAPGTYTLTISNVGFSIFSTRVTVQSAAPIRVNAVLKPGTQNEAITVHADREGGEMEALDIERTADNIVQVLPADVITSLPNTNIADAVGRLPSVSLERDEGEGKYVQIRGTEPRLSNVTVDGIHLPSPEGNVRNIKLDIIPSSVVDRIEVFKTLSANQDGDAIGGTVNLVTKTPAERPTLDLEGQGGYTNIIGGRWLDAFNGTVGQRLGQRKQFGLLFAGTYDWNGRGINDLEPLPGAVTFNGNNYATFSTADLRTYKYYRTRYGFAPEVDYVIKPGSTIYLKGLYSDFHDFGEVWVYTPNTGTQVASTDGTNFTFSDPGNMQYRHYVRRPDQQIYSFLTGTRVDQASMYYIVDFAVSRAHNIGGQDFATTK